MFIVVILLYYNKKFDYPNSHYSGNGNNLTTFRKECKNIESL